MAVSNNFIMTKNSDKELKEEHKEFLNQFFFEGFQPPPKLYHYTDDGGFNGFFGNKTIWLTSYKFMNDSTEFTYGINILEKKLNEFLKQPSYTNEFSKTCKGIWNLIKEDSVAPKIKPYIYCLSEERDNLGQWRAYAKDGTGYCLEFDSSGLQGLDNQILLGQVQYDEDMYEALCANFVQKWLELCLNIAAKNGSFIPSVEMRLLARIFIQCAFSLMIKFKHKGFWLEKEWRLIKFLPSDSSDLNYRSHRFGTADYFIQSIDPQTLVTEVLSGPKGTIVDKKTANIPNNIECKKSSIPYV